MIHAKTPLPAERSSDFFTTVHNQTSITFQVFEGPWLMTRRNRLLGSFTITGIPAAEPREEPVKVTVRVDCDGVLQISACVVSNGNTASLIVTKTGHLFSEQKVLRTMAERDAEKGIDEREYDEARRSSKIERLAMNFRTFLDEEPKSNSTFARYISASEYPALRRIADSMLPSALGRLPTHAEIKRVRSKLQDAVRKYIVLGRKGRWPKWL
jgi:molecular chaperone DnaK (HSP70)